MVCLDKNEIVSLNEIWHIYYMYKTAKLLKLNTYFLLTISSSHLLSVGWLFPKLILRQWFLVLHLHPHPVRMLYFCFIAVTLDIYNSWTPSSEKNSFPTLSSSFVLLIRNIRSVYSISCIARLKFNNNVFKHITEGLGLAWLMLSLYYVQLAFLYICYKII